MKIKTLSVKRPKSTVSGGEAKSVGSLAKVVYEELHYKSDIKEDFTCPYCSAHFKSDEEYSLMHETGECPYCHEKVYYYTEWYWDMFFHAVGDDPVWFGKRYKELEPLFKFNALDGGRVLNVAMNLAWNNHLYKVVEQYKQYI
jgi:uncharacterized Zn-finger protein